MKLRLIALMLSGLILCAPTAREEAQTVMEPEAEEAVPVEAAPEITPVPPAAAATEPRAQERYFEICEEIPAEDEAPEEPTIWREDVPLSAELQAALLAICEEAGVDPLLALGLIETESNFVTDAVSRTGDYGLCQLNHLYFPTDLTPEENMRRGIGYLAELLKRYGSTETALTAYHIGHDDGTRYYAGAVLGHARAWGYGA